MFSIAEDISNDNVEKIIQVGKTRKKLAVKLGYKSAYVCYRCKDKDKAITALCLDCRKAFYCSAKCLRKNRDIHLNTCLTYLEINPVIDNINKSLRENYESRKEQQGQEKVKVGNSLINDVKEIKEENESKSSKDS